MSDTSHHTIRAGAIEVTLDLLSGTIIRLHHRDREWTLLEDASLGRSFRLTVPIGARRNNVVEGIDQRAPRTSISDEGRTVAFHWDGVRSEHGGEHPIRVSTTVRAVGSSLRFAVDIENDSEFSVENVTYPLLGQVVPPEDSGRLEAFTQSAATASVSSIWPNFESTVGYFGVDHPTYLPRRELGETGPPVAPFVLLQDGSSGIYLGVAEARSDVIAWWAQLVPGWEDSLSARAPHTPEIDGHRVSVEFGAVHVPFLAAGARRALTPIALEAFTGTWHSGADVYVRERSRWDLPDSVPPRWAQESDAWLQLQVNSPEGEYRWMFADLPRVADLCAEAGIRVIQLVGWNDGGQDQNNPSHDPDPILGGAEALAAAIAECQRRGVRVVLFSKFNWADRATPRFRQELIREAVKDPYGDYYQYGGYHYQTTTQLLDINTKRLIPMCFASERYLQVAETEFAKIVELGADGHLFDEGQHHTPALLCFDPDHGHDVPEPVYGHDLPFFERLDRQVRSARPDFLHVVEAGYDWEMSGYHMSYMRSKSRDYIPLARYLRPRSPMMSAVVGFGGDRNMLNQCLLYRFAISYEPYNFKGLPGDFPETIAYGREVDRLRRDLRNWFWDGEFRDTVGATVTREDGAAHHPYAVYEGAEEGSGRAVAIANYDDHEIRVDVDVPGGPLAALVVGETRWRMLDGAVQIPATSCVIIAPYSEASRTGSIAG